MRSIPLAMMFATLIMAGCGPSASERFNQHLEAMDRQILVQGLPHWYGNYLAMPGCHEIEKMGKSALPHIVATVDKEEQDWKTRAADTGGTNPWVPSHRSYALIVTAAKICKIDMEKLAKEMSFYAVPTVIDSPEYYNVLKEMVWSHVQK